MPKFGNPANYETVREPGDPGTWNVPRVGKLEKTNYLNRPWLIKKQGLSSLFNTMLKEEEKLKKKNRNEYHYVKSRYKPEGSR